MVHGPGLGPVQFRYVMCVSSLAWHTTVNATLWCDYTQRQINTLMPEQNDMWQMTLSNESSMISNLIKISAKFTPNNWHWFRQRLGTIILTNDVPANYAYTQIAKTVVSTSIRHLSDTLASDRCLIICSWSIHLFYRRSWEIIIGLVNGLMARRRTADKPSSKPMLSQFSDAYIYVYTYTYIYIYIYMRRYRETR